MMLKQYALQLPDNILYEVILFELVTEQKREKSIKTLKKNPTAKQYQRTKQLLVLEDCILRIVSCPSYRIFFLREVLFLGAHIVLLPSYCAKIIDQKSHYLVTIALLLIEK